MRNVYDMLYEFTESYLEKVDHVCPFTFGIVVDEDRFQDVPFNVYYVKGKHVGIAPRTDGGGYCR